jgi:signal transduction histidine kinase
VKILDRLNIQQRILLTFLIIIIVGGLLQILIAGRQLETAAFEFFKHDLETEALATTATLGGSFENVVEGEGSLQYVLQNLQRNTAVSYAITDTNLRILAYRDSSGQESLRTLPQTPEITEAGRGELGTDLRDGHYYVAAPIRGEERLVGYLILSASLDPAYNETRRYWLELSAASLPVLLLAAISSFWIGRTITNPIRQLHDSALKMAGGALDTRINIQSHDEIGELAQTFNEMAEHLEDLMRVQRSFVSNAAHELRTPLMKLKLRIESLQDPTLETTHRSTYLSEINQELDYMAHLVTSLLTLARLDEGRYSLDQSPADCSAFIQDIARNWRIQAQKAGLQFYTDIAPDLPDTPLSAGDLRMVLDNLLSNAIKYTPHGEVQLHARANSNRLCISVSDTGQGFDPADSKRLFERFFRGEAVRNQQHIPGTGLGLAILQAVVQHYGGQIYAHSDGYGRGALFEIQLPTVQPKT